MAASQSASTLPQGFSVYQPMLGAPLQFFPALGTKELDDMIDAFIAGPVSIKEKRASVSVDFLEYAQRTGQTFKFYAVAGLNAAAADSPAAASPFQTSASVSSINASPVTSNWDWSSVSAPSASQTSTYSHGSRRASTAASSSHRHTSTDFSHLPGMKILTKDGMDITNSASRGSKTKEQRDHAHLMRIIKACDSCRKKKIRCDPSHKRRAVASQAHAQPASKTTKKAKSPSQKKPSTAAPAAIAKESFPPPQTSFAFDPSLDYTLFDSFNNFESFDLSAPMAEPWEEFVQYPPMEPDYDFFLDPNRFFSEGEEMQASTSTTPFTSSPEERLLTTFSSTPSSSSPELVDYGNFPMSLSTSPEIRATDGYVTPADLSMSSSPELASERHVLPDYPMPPGVSIGSTSSQEEWSQIERARLRSRRIAGLSTDAVITTPSATGLALLESERSRLQAHVIESFIRPGVDHHMIGGVDDHKLGVADHHRLGVANTHMEPVESGYTRRVITQDVYDGKDSRSKSEQVPSFATEGHANFSRTVVAPKTKPLDPNDEIQPPRPHGPRDIELWQKDNIQSGNLAITNVHDSMKDYIQSLNTTSEEREPHDPASRAPTSGRLLTIAQVERKSASRPASSAVNVEPSSAAASSMKTAIDLRNANVSLTIEATQVPTSQLSTGERVSSLTFLEEEPRGELLPGSVNSQSYGGDNLNRRSICPIASAPLSSRLCGADARPENEALDQAAHLVDGQASGAKAPDSMGMSTAACQTGHGLRTLLESRSRQAIPTVLSGSLPMVRTITNPLTGAEESAAQDSGSLKSSGADSLTGTDCCGTTTFWSGLATALWLMAGLSLASGLRMLVNKPIERTTAKKNGRSRNPRFLSALIPLTATAVIS